MRPSVFPFAQGVVAPCLPISWSTVFGSWYFLAMPMRTLMLLPKHRCLGSGVGLDPKSSNLTLLRPGLSRKGREVVEEL